jgi:hypothetical protein
MELFEVLQDSLQAATSFEEEPLPKSQLHRQRSRRWVDSLGKRLELEYPPRLKFRVFWRDNYRNRSEFRLNEFLFDISVCEISFVASASKSKRLTFVRNVIWQIESEFARDSRQSIFDFNKLVAGSAQNKLFIAPIVSIEDEFLSVFRLPASYCFGNVFMAMIPHPTSWPNIKEQVRLWRFNDGNWISIEQHIN